MTDDTPRRVVTGHDNEGRSVVLSDAPPPAHTNDSGVTFHEIWATEETPAPIGPAEPDPAAGPLHVTPAARGTIVHVIDMPPGSSAPMHRTRTIDYGVVLSGEIDLELDDGSVTRLGPGDVIVQRGTAHGWCNRSPDVARMLFVLVDGEFTDELRATVGDEALAQLYEQR